MSELTHFNAGSAFGFTGRHTAHFAGKARRQERRLGSEEIENQLKEKAEGASLRLLSYMDGRIPSWAAS